MPGLVPGIHVLCAARQGVDGRDKPGHDDVGTIVPDVHCSYAIASPLAGARTRPRRLRRWHSRCRMLISHEHCRGHREDNMEAGMVTPAPALVRFSGIQKTYDGEHLVVKNLDLDIRKGEFITLLGPSGSGKTTTLMMLAGFEVPTHGEIYLSERPIKNVPPHRRDIGMVFQNYALFPHMTVEENLAFPLKVRKERVKLNPAPGSLPNIFSARVAEVIYLGDHVRARISVGAHDNFVIKLPNSEGVVQLAPGAAITSDGRRRIVGRSTRHDDVPGRRREGGGQVFGNAVPILGIAEQGKQTMRKLLMISGVLAVRLGGECIDGGKACFRARSADHRLLGWGLSGGRAQGVVRALQRQPGSRSPKASTTARPPSCVVWSNPTQ